MTARSLLLGSLLLVSTLHAQVTGNIQFSSSDIHLPREQPQAVLQSDNSILVDVNAIMNVKADSYVAVFNVSQTAPTIEQVQQLTDSRIRSIREALQQLSGVQQVFVDMLSLVPVYELEEDKKIFSRNTYDELPAGFELQKNIHIRYQDPDLLDELILICGKQEVYDLVKVDYYVEDFAAYYDTLRAACRQFLDQRLAEYQVSGIQIDTTRALLAESSDYSQPVERYRDYSAYIANAYQGQQQSKIVHRQRKKITQYYQPISYKGYNIVIHPEIVQPVLQFTFNLKARYFLPREKGAEKEIYILTPEGNLKRLAIE
ncbi:MAG: SIMPL domain-containing protein [Lewinella sp.]|nr:SIMPL domain-containing protein [Lewinella sp.]